MKVLKEKRKDIERLKKFNIEKQKREKNTYIFTCNHCGSKIEVVKNDLKYVGGTCKYFDCPVCDYSNVELDIDLTIGRLKSIFRNIFKK